MLTVSNMLVIYSPKVKNVLYALLMPSKLKVVTLVLNINSTKPNNPNSKKMMIFTVLDVKTIKNVILKELKELLMEIVPE